MAFLANVIHTPHAVFLHINQLLMADKMCVCVRRPSFMYIFFYVIIHFLLFHFIVGEIENPFGKFNLKR